MIGVRLSAEYQRRFEELARRSNSKMSPGPFARRILIAYIEQHAGGGQPTLEAKVDSIARHVERLEEKIDALLEQIDIVA